MGGGHCQVCRKGSPTDPSACDPGLVCKETIATSDPSSTFGIPGYHCMYPNETSCRAGDGK